MYPSETMVEAIASQDELFRLFFQYAFHDIFMKMLVGVTHLPLDLIVLHYIDKEVIALLYVRLYLLQSTILFAKNAFELPCSKITKEIHWSKVVNLIWLMLPTVTFCALIFCYVWINWLPLPPERLVEGYQSAVKIFGVSCVIEALVEPVYIFSQAFLYLKLEENVKYVALFIRISPLVIAAIFFPEYTIQATAYGELASSIVRLILFWGFFYFELAKKTKLLETGQLHRGNPLFDLPFSSLSEFLPKNVFSCQPFLDAELARKILRISKQDLIPQVLGRGRQYLMAGTSAISFAEQGTFEAVSGMALVPALRVFAPLQIHSFNYFTRKLDRNKTLKDHTPDSIKEVSNALYTISRTFALLGCGLFTFGLSYSHLVAKTYGGSTLTDWPGSLLLKLQCFTILLKAINAPTGSYAWAAMSYNSFKRCDTLVDLFYCFSLIISVVLSYTFGTVVFIISDWCYLVLRIVCSIWFINQHFEGVPERPLSGLLPNKRELLAFGAALVTTLSSEWFIYPYATDLHLAWGILCAFYVFKAIVFIELGSWDRMRAFTYQAFFRSA